MRPFLWLVVKGPYNGLESMQQIDHLPKLVVQSTRDRDVPRARGLALYAAARNPKALWEVPGTHLGAMAYDPAGYLRHVDALLAQATMSASPSTPVGNKAR